MMRTITVRGVGNVSAKPDYITISMTIESIRKDYEGAMKDASERISKLQDVAVRSGYANFGIYFILHGNLLSKNRESSSALRWYSPIKNDCHVLYLLPEWITSDRRDHDLRELNSSCPLSGMRYTVS